MEKPREAPSDYQENINEIKFREILEQRTVDVIDVREPVEREMDGELLVKPGVNVTCLSLEDMSYGVNLNHFNVGHPLLCVCTNGLKSGRAASYLRLRDVKAQRLIGGLKSYREVMNEFHP